MKKPIDRSQARKRIHRRIRKRVAGTAEKPRVAVYRSLHHIYAQVIDDRLGRTLAAASSAQENSGASGGNVAGAKVVGKVLAERALAKGIKQVVFDRGGYRFHGRVKALADAAREAGLQF